MKQAIANSHSSEIVQISDSSKYYGMEDHFDRLVFLWHRSILTLLLNECHNLDLNILNF